MRVPDHIGSWLRDRLIPIWSERAILPRQAGFAESFTPDFRPDEGGPRSTLVTARLVYVFSHGHLLSGTPQALAAAREGYAFLTGMCRDGRSGRFMRRVGLDGAPLDEVTDLYDLAFVLLACAWYLRATGEPQALALAENTAQFIESEMRHPEGGFREDTRGSLPRRQNPHMHLLEACLALAEATREERWKERTITLASLMHDRFRDPETGALIEFFTEDLSPDQRRGNEREPGHHFEWFWLFGELRRITGTDAFSGAADRLYDFAMRHGIERIGALAGAAHETISNDGSIISASKLLWPQTEALKAHLTRFELRPEAAASALVSQQLSLIFRYFLDAESGFWHNRLAPDRKALPVEMPTRVLYHIVMALAEYARLESRLAALN